ncbi:MAG TPA: 3-phosphoshikimate 1-carboxyvinyltransferase [Gemmatimonadaceae bacterium]|nr:3-phosphoshikimate 1-carboxyvinyltransferase [Gemmatimonadaceae bacterium]
MTGRGIVRVPGDKSISHRALIFGALATGQSQISGILESADVQSTAQVLRSLGVSIPDISPSFSFSGRGLRGLRQPGSPLDCGNSGTTVRLMSGVVAGHPFSARFEGDASLSRRPMKRIADPLTQMGARFEFARGDGLPMTIHGGRLSGIAWNTKAASAQTKSAILLAGLVGGVQVSVIELFKSRDHTERMLTSLGAPVETDDTRVSLSPVDSIAPVDITVPGDPSSAAYMIAFAVLGGIGMVELPEVCVNKTRIGFIEAMIRMGARIEYKNRKAVAGDTSATIIARTSKLRDMKIESSDIPAMIDELPLLACVAAAAGVSLEVSGAAELRVKESDRIAVVVRNLRSIGVSASELPDGFRVDGARARLSGRIATENDHRMAMAFGVLGALHGNAIDMDNPDCVRVSYPHFWDDLERLRA